MELHCDGSRPVPHTSLCCSFCGVHPAALRFGSCGEAWRNITGPRAPGTTQQAVDVGRTRRTQGTERGAHPRPAVRLSRRFLPRWCELDDLSALFRRSPLLFFSKAVWYVELDYFCHSMPTFSSKFPHAVYGVATRFRSVWPCHSHPHWQRTKSLKLSFFSRALQIAHDLIHIAVLQTSDSPAKAASVVCNIGVAQVKAGCGAVVLELLNDCPRIQHRN